MWVRTSISNAWLNRGFVRLRHLVGLLAARNVPGLTRRRWGTVLALTLTASAVMLGDYLWVYSPLAEMITPPGSSRHGGFVGFHEASKIINLIQLGLCLTAALIANWPLSHDKRGHDKMTKSDEASV